MRADVLVEQSRKVLMYCSPGLQMINMKMNQIRRCNSLCINKAVNVLLLLFDNCARTDDEGVRVQITRTEDHTLNSLLEYF